MLDAAAGTVLRALAKVRGNVATFDVPGLAYRAGLVEGKRMSPRRPDVPPELAGRLSAYFFVLRDAPAAVPGWRIELETEYARPRLVCRRLTPAAS